MIPENEITKLYDSYAEWKGWLNDKKFFTISEKEKTHFTNQFNKIKLEYEGKDILEYGYGAGDLLKFFHLNNCNISGVEIQESLLKVAKKNKIKVYNSIDEIIEDKFDIITAIDVLEHMTTNQIMSFFNSASKLLKHDGKMVFRFPNGESPASLPAQNGDFTHLNAIGKTKLTQLCEPFGFEVEYFDGEYVASIPFPLNIIRKFSRFLFRKLTGLGNSYFFYCNVIAVVKKIDLQNRKKSFFRLND